MKGVNYLTNDEGQKVAVQLDHLAKPLGANSTNN